MKFRDFIEVKFYEYIIVNKYDKKLLIELVKEDLKNILSIIN